MDMDTDEFVAATMRRVAASAVPPAPEAVRPATTRRWHAPLAVVATAAAIALIVAVAGLVSTHRSAAGPSAHATAKNSPPAASTCRLDYPSKPLPTWARAGFTPPDQPVTFVLGDRGDMAAIVWASHHPLVAPPSTSRNNKILWVARVGAAEGPLKIRATLESTGQTVTRTLAAAPGPSTIDLPAAGCWSFDLTWGSHEDHLVLGYAAR
jgi:hypothetical protein